MSAEPGCGQARPEGPVSPPITVDRCWPADGQQPQRVTALSPGHTEAPGCELVPRAPRPWDAVSSRRPQNGGPGAAINSPAGFSLGLHCLWVEKAYLPFSAAGPPRLCYNLEESERSYRGLGDLPRRGPGAELIKARVRLCCSRLRHSPGILIEHTPGRGERSPWILQC